MLLLRRVVSLLSIQWELHKLRLYVDRRIFLLLSGRGFTTPFRPFNQNGSDTRQFSLQLLIRNSRFICLHTYMLITRQKDNTISEIATVRISELFIVMLQCDNSDGTKAIKETQTKTNDDYFLLSAFFSYLT